MFRFEVRGDIREMGVSKGVRPALPSDLLVCDFVRGLSVSVATPSVPLHVHIHLI